MQITIDTNKDSKEDIEKAIQLLSSLSNSRINSNSDLFSNSSPTSLSQSSSIPTTSSTTSTDSSTSNSEPQGIFNMFSNNQALQSANEAEKDEEQPKVQIIQY